MWFPPWASAAAIAEIIPLMRQIGDNDLQKNIKKPLGALSRSLPERPRRPKEAPRAAQEPPRLAQEPARIASEMVLGPTRRPSEFWKSQVQFWKSKSEFWKSQFLTGKRDDSDGDHDARGPCETFTETRPHTCAGHDQEPKTKVKPPQRHVSEMRTLTPGKSGNRPTLATQGVAPTGTVGNTDIQWPV